MKRTPISLNGRIREAIFSVGEQNDLHLELTLESGTRHLVFHDYLKRGATRFFLFHHKTRLIEQDGGVLLRTPAMEKELGESIRGLTADYLFSFDKEEAAFSLSVSLGSDAPVTDIEPRLFEVSWKDADFDRFTGYEYDAEGKPYQKEFPFPADNPDAPDYETLLTMTPHAAWEKMKTRPHGFQKAVSVEGEKDFLAVSGGAPTFHVETRYIAAFPTLAEFAADLRFFSGKNGPRALFLLEKPADLFRTCEALEQRFPAREEAVYLPFPKEEYSLSAGALELTLLQSNSGVWSRPIGNDGGRPLPLFTLTLKDTTYGHSFELDAGEGWDSVQVLCRDGYARILLSDPLNGRAEGISVVAEAFCDGENNRIRWKTHCVNRSERYSVTRISYPQCQVFGRGTAFANVECGLVTKDFNKRSMAYCAKYPLGFRAPMGFCAVYDETARENGGFYMGIHDSSGFSKHLYMAGAPESDLTLMGALFPAEYPGQAGNSQTLPGEMIWQVYTGDWYDASLIYRNFVHTGAQWFYARRGRADTPDWLRDNPVWIMHFLPNENPDANPVPVTLREQYPDTSPEDWYKTAIRFREQIGVPTAYHVYNWHWVPFNNDNPHYFPAHHDFKKGVQALKNADIRVIPYMAAYSWDMHDRRGDDYRFENEALPNTAKNPDGSVLHKSYASTEPNGEGVKFARMCPSTAFWKNEVRQVVKQLYTDYGADGIYLDVIAAAYDQCFDPTHLHKPGASDFWWRSYEELIVGLRAQAPKDFALVSEAIAEVYVSALDGYLSWTWIVPNQVPAFPTVYGGYTQTIGRVISANKRDDADYFRFHMAQCFLYGQQLGWIHPEIVDDKEQFPFLKKLANLRWRDAKFFRSAQMLRPPVVEGDMKLLDASPFLRLNYYTHEKCALAGAFEDVEGARHLYVINSANTEATVTVSFPTDEYRMPALSDFTESDGATLLGIREENGKTVLSCRIAPQGFGKMVWSKGESL
ncbi:MAG: hypothetical protein IJX28_07640 [Clostridia bacterium]|nr:hypothetical protein [Clostridia bacterium]